MNIDLNPILSHTGHWLATVVPDVVVIVVIAIVAHRLLLSFGTRVVQHSVKPRKFASQRDVKLREDTLLSLLHSVTALIVWGIAGLMIFSRVFPHINLAALGVSAGVLGIVIGFGAQNLVKDFSAGIFILLEDQYRVGDVVQINQTLSGVVESISLRITTLRSYGNLHVIPNGTITSVTNMTKDYSNLNIDLRVGYGTDVDKAEEIINKVGNDMMADDKWQEFLIEKPSFLRLDAFNESTMTLKIVAKTAPVHQWEVAGEYRRRLKKAFDDNQIELPYANIVMRDSPKSGKNKKS